MSADSFFYAALAGARADSLASWKQYAAEQEAQVAQLQQQLVAWQREAVLKNAGGIYEGEALERLGTTAEAVYGADAERAEQEAINRSKNFYQREYNINPFQEG